MARSSLRQRQINFRRIRELMGEIPADPHGAAVVVNKALIHPSACPEHPRYQAKRPPKHCATCGRIFAVKAQGEKS